MLLYKKVPRYNQFTGKPIDPILEKYGFICDFTGERINSDSMQEDPIYFLSFKYDHASEPLWYEDYHKFQDAFELDYSEFSSFMNSPYHFSHTIAYGDSDVSEWIALKWADALRDKDSKDLLADCHTIEQAFRHFRLETLMKLLKNKTYTLEELGFREDCEK